MALPLLDPPFCVTVTGTRYAFEPELYAVIMRSESDKTKDEKEWLISVRTCWSESEVTPLFPQRTAKDGSDYWIHKGITSCDQAKRPGNLLLAVPEPADLGIVESVYG